MIKEHEVINTLKEEKIKKELNEIEKKNPDMDDGSGSRLRLHIIEKRKRIISPKKCVYQQCIDMYAEKGFDIIKSK